MPNKINPDNAYRLLSKKTVTPQQLSQWCDELLQVRKFKDYCPNGLQIDADTQISKIITGVTASEALIDEAIAQKAQAILVHHGYFWKGEEQPLIGMKGRRVRKLLQNNISLIAYHLPLDAHETIGNNAQLARDLDFSVTEKLFEEYHQNPAKVGDIVELQQPINGDELFEKIHKALHKEPIWIKSTGFTKNRKYKRVGLCTGAAQDFIGQAARMQCDAYISGEISERTTHEARELGVDYFCCGHHATEKGGVKALGEYISAQLGLEVLFVDIDNPA